MVRRNAIQIRGSFIPIWILRVNKDFGDWKGQWTGVIWKMRERQSFALMAEGVPGVKQNAPAGHSTHNSPLPDGESTHGADL